MPRHLQCGSVSFRIGLPVCGYAGASRLNVSFQGLDSRPRFKASIQDPNESEDDGSLQPCCTNARKECSAGIRRRAREELGMPVANQSARPKNRRGDSDRDHHDDGRSGGDRCGRVQKDAERAMAGVFVDRVFVGDLNERQQGDEQDAYDRGQGPIAHPGAPLTAKVCLKSGQSINP